MKIAVVDHSFFRREQIKKVCLQEYAQAELYDFSSLVEIINFLKYDDTNLDLIILNWHLPIIENSHEELEVGKEVLEQLLIMNKETAVIICSKEEVDIQDKYDTLVAGQIQFNKLLDGIPHRKNITLRKNGKTSKTIESNQYIKKPRKFNRPFNL